MSKRKASSDRSPSPNRVPPQPLGPLTDYKQFLDSHITRKAPAKLSPATINKWSDVDVATDQGKIVNEIAKKFNTSHSQGIKNVAYTRGAGQPNFYEGISRSGGTKMTLAPPPNGKVPKGPNPVVVAHELVHANDHQIDHLNPKVWKHLETLATTGANGGPMQSFDEFGTAVRKIQDKIDPTKAFSSGGYPIDQAYIEKEIKGAADMGGKVPYTPPLTADNSPDWIKLFQDIDRVVNYLPPAAAAAAVSPKPNPGFYLNRASEFPAFMSENLTRPWGANQSPNRLSAAEAQFMHSTLRSMGAAYPSGPYPTLNHHINDRSRSLERAYPSLFTSQRAPTPPSPLSQQISSSVPPSSSSSSLPSIPSSSRLSPLSGMMLPSPTLSSAINVSAPQTNPSQTIGRSLRNRPI